MAIYVIGIGGTGAKCIESIIQLAAIGVFRDEKINLLFVDADETNGNLDRTQRSLEIYQGCYGLGLNLETNHWMNAQIKSYGLWSPFANISINKNLGALFEYNNLKYDDPVLGQLFDVLYEEDERELNLDEGFRGRPAIGAAVMSQVNLEQEEVWQKMIVDIKNEPGSQTKIFLCGSIFGGTGASGLPTIGRLIVNKLEKDAIRDRIQIGCLFMLPYFSFQPSLQETEKQKVFARAEEFLLNTEAALRYYANQAKEIFDKIYLLGNESPATVEFSVGRNSQRNDPHFVELYGALAMQNFLNLEKVEQRGEVVLIARQTRSRLFWQDLPELSFLQPLMIDAVRFAYFWLGEIVPELNNAKVKNIAKASPWFNNFYPSGGLFSRKSIDFSSEEEQTAIAKITGWCQDYLRWVRDIHGASAPEEINLFNVNYFKNPESNLNMDHFANLVAQEVREESKRKEDTATNLINNESIFNSNGLTAPNIGTIGLAKALYRGCASQYR